MKNKISLALLTLSLPFLFWGFNLVYFTDRCDCKTSDHPYRFLIKHDTAFAGLPERRSFITVETIRSWEKKYPIDLLLEQDKRVANTPEDTIYNLQGWLYLVKTDKSDCDLHLQVGPKDPNKMRVDIEIPPEECALQNLVLKQLEAIKFKFDVQNPKPIYFEARGPAFFDGANRGRPGKKHTGGCSWEIHPVREIIFK